MKRIMVFGNGGSGKSTLSNKLGKKLNIPVIHLDQLYWQPGWVKTPKPEFHEKIKDYISNNPSWVMDGNYTSSLDFRLPLADTIIFLDMPRWLCFYRVTKRLITHHGQTRPDMTDNCPERIGLEFIQWIWNYPKLRKDIMNKVSSYQDKNLIILKNKHQVSDFTNKIKTK